MPEISPHTSLHDNYASTTILGYYYGYSVIICSKYEESSTIFCQYFVHIVLYCLGKVVSLITTAYLPARETVLFLKVFLYCVLKMEALCFVCGTNLFL